MLNAYERQLIFFYLCNAASRFHHDSNEARSLADWFEENHDLLALNDESEEPGKHWVRRGHKWVRRGHKEEEEISAREWQRLRKTLENEYSAACKEAQEDLTARRLRQLGREMDLEPEDVAVLEIMLRYSMQQVIESLIEDILAENFPHSRRRNFFSSTSYLLPCFLGVPASSLHARFAADAPLMKSGLLSVDDDGDIRRVSRLDRLASVPDDGDLDVCRLLLDMPAPGELEWADFEHVAEDRDHIEKLVKGALSTGTTGVNILVHGSPGTGKTEFCKTLAAQLGANLYSVGEEAERRERLQELRLAQHLLAPSRGSILLFDEMEDILSDPSSVWMPFSPGGFSPLRSGGSKVFLNRILECTPVPTLWTSNSAEATCQTVLRRMTFALELCKPPCRVRERIWKRELARRDIEATEQDARSLAKEFDVTPGIASSAIAAARLCGRDLAAVRLGVRSLSRVISGEKPPANQGPPEKFDLGLVRSDMDPVGLADRIAKSGGKHFSLCLQGPPGTGKSAFVRYLAERLGLQVTQKRASDLMSMWVGETEKQIAAAFSEARAEGSILVFDEADSLLADRRGAVRSWEVSQVNEMLTWMESHPLPFACTTNFGENLDPATLRRFTFKIALDYLTPDQSQAAFHTYFALQAPPEIGDLTTLTPGDFAVVRRKAEILGHLQDAKALAELLCAECEAKPNHARKIGF